jgi:hypothetical protein
VRPHFAIHDEGDRCSTHTVFAGELQPIAAVVAVQAEFELERARLAQQAERDRVSAGMSREEMARQAQKDAYAAAMRSAGIQDAPANANRTMLTP